VLRRVGEHPEQPRGAVGLAGRPARGCSWGRPAWPCGAPRLAADARPRGLARRPRENRIVSEDAWRAEADYCTSVGRLSQFARGFYLFYNSSGTQRPVQARFSTLGPSFCPVLSSTASSVIQSTVHVRPPP
jgi:hypothetical protein